MPSVLDLDALGIQGPSLGSLAGRARLLEGCEFCKIREERSLERFVLGRPGPSVRRRDGRRLVAATPMFAMPGTLSGTLASSAGDATRTAGKGRISGNRQSESLRMALFNGACLRQFVRAPPK